MLRAIGARPAVRRLVLWLIVFALTAVYAVAETRASGREPGGAAARAASAADAPYVNPMPAAPTGRLLDGTTLVAAADPLTGPNVTAVSQTGPMMDLFGVDSGQRIYHASWTVSEPNGWNRSAQLNGGVAAPGTSVYAVSRFKGRVDAFAVGTDRRVYTAWKQTRIAPGWQGWSVIRGLKVKPNTSVTAVKLDRLNMMILAVGEDGTIYTNFWTDALNVWQGWDAIPGIQTNYTVFGLGLSATDVFVYASATRPYMTRWTAGGWQDWRLIGDDLVGTAGPIYPVRFSDNEINVFTTSPRIVQDNRQEFDIVTATYTIGANRWRNFHKLLGGQAYNPTAPITAVSRQPGYIDVFHIGRNSHVYGASFNPTDHWQGWFDMGQVVREGTGAFVHSRGTDRLDVFIIKPNTGTYSASWSPATGWGCWCEVGPYGQAGDAIEVTERLDFDGGTNVDGSMTLMVSASGAWSFRGRFDSAGPFSHDVSYAVVIATPGGRAFVFRANGRAKGWLDGGGDFTFDRAGVDPDLAANWSEIRSSGEWNSRGRTSLDVSQMLGDLLVTVAYPIGIVDTVTS